MRDAGMTAASERLGADTVHYWAGGHGPTVLLIHGFGASATWLWYPQVEDLARDHRVILPDLLWFGDSRSDDRDFSLDHQVKMVEALLDRLGEREADVVGVSYGGLVAHELASDRAASMRHLVLVDTPGRVYTREDYRLLCRRFHVPHLGKVLVPRDPDGVETLLGIAYYDPPWVPAFALQQTLTSLYATYREERVALLDSLLGTMEVLEARPSPCAPGPWSSGVARIPSSRWRSASASLPASTRRCASWSTRATRPTWSTRRSSTASCVASWRRGDEPRGGSPSRPAGTVMATAFHLG